jgi:hypothetical protein
MPRYHCTIDHTTGTTTVVVGINQYTYHTTDLTTIDWQLITGLPVT